MPMNNVRSLSFLLIIFLFGCKSNIKNHHHFNKAFNISYQLNIEKENVKLSFFDETGRLINTIRLPDSEYYIEQALLKGFCQQGDLCEENKSNKLISWSHDLKYLSIFSGKYTGFWFIPAKAINDDELEPNIIKLGLTNIVMGNQNDLFHKAGGWINESEYVFSAGLSGKDYVYIFDLHKQLLKGAPFELRENSHVNSFIPIFTSAYNNQHHFFEVDNVSEQLKQLASSHN